MSYLDLPGDIFSIIVWKKALNILQLCDPFFLLPYYTVYPFVLAISIVSSHVVLSPLYMCTESDNVTAIAIHRNVDTHGMGKVVGVGSSAHRKVTSSNTVRSRTDPVLPIVMLLDTP